MDTISGSRFSLDITDSNKLKYNTDNSRINNDKYPTNLQSYESISNYEKKNYKNLLPQMLASSIAGLFHIVVGISLAYSAILLPQLDEKGSDLKITKSEGSWIASVITIVIPISGMTCGFLMDSIGRLNTVKLATVPAVIGWILIATSSSVEMLIIGRIITGFAAAWGTSPAMVYITEIARNDMRGSLMSFAPAYTSLGIVLAYFQGWLMNWRTVAWVCNIYAIVPFILLMFVHESPAWLVSKNRTDQAKRSLIWFNKYQPQPTNKSVTFAELQLQSLIREHEKKQTTTNINSWQRTAKEFLKPTCYKPLLILLGLFVFQQFSGIYITLFYSITFFKEVGSDIDPYFVSILIGGVRFFISVINTYMLKTFRRRSLIMFGSTAMAVCMFISGLFTYWIKEGTTKMSWVPVITILFYVVASMIGLLSIPWTMTAEMFPIEIRGVAHSVVYSSAYFLMFISIQNYNLLNDLFNGVAGLQWFFAVVSLAGLVYSYILLPETHGVKLSDIQDYFNYNCIYIGNIKTKKNLYSNSNNNSSNNNKKENRDLIINKV